MRDDEREIERPIGETVIPSQRFGNLSPTLQLLAEVQLLSLREVAGALCIKNTQLIRRMVREGYLPARRGHRHGQWLITVADLMRFQDEIHPYLDAVTLTVLHQQQVAAALQRRAEQLHRQKTIAPDALL